jgi:hypothetical protein
MTKCKEFVCEWVYDFVDKNWDNIEHKKCDLNKTTKEKFLKEVKKDPQTAMWVITEVMIWSMDKNYTKDLMVFPKPDQDTDEVFKVIKLNDKYIKIIWHHEEKCYYSMTFTEPKTKTITVEYFE